MTPPTLPFRKYQGTGNDFVLIDNRRPVLLHGADTERIRRLCDRRFGIGADGLMLLQEAPGYDFEMVYFNSDGRESTMCGNGGRCIVAFAQSLGIIQHHCRFLAVDGPHEARIESPERVALRLADVPHITAGEGYYCLDTGSPHYVCFVPDVQVVDVQERGAALRYSPPFREQGINVNFVMETPEGISVATYERGVEAETLSCGTGVTASVLAYARRQGIQHAGSVQVQTKGGLLEVTFQPEGEGFTQVWLCGPAVAVFDGVVRG